MAHTFAPEEYQEIGKSHYKHKQYEKAIEAFTNGIDASAVPSATLYDYRAACHEKLRDFSAAVKDGRLAIRTHKKNVKGYLRTASALQKMDRSETALEIYKYGMKNVEVGNADFQLLQQLHDKLTRKLSPPKAIDPLTILPVELAEYVIGYLSFKTIVNCLRVSKGWKEYLTKRPKLWANLDLSGASRPVSRRFLRNAVQYSRSSVHTLVVHRIQHTDILCNIAVACKNLQALVVLSFPHMISETLFSMAQSANNLRHLCVHTETDVHTINEILRRRPELEYLEFREARMLSQHGRVVGQRSLQLRTLIVQGVIEFASSIQNLVEKASELRSVVLNHTGVRKRIYDRPPDFGSSNITDLVYLNFTGPWVPILPATLKRVNLNLAYEWPDMWNHFERMLKATRTRDITHLTFGKDIRLYPKVLESFLDFYTDDSGTITSLHDAAPLQHLSLSGDLYVDNPDRTPSALSAVSPRIVVSAYLATSPRILTPSLTSLEIPGFPLTDDDIKPITALTKLEHIDVSRSKISGLGIKLLVDEAPTLRFINAEHCENLSSRDALEYAESKGVRVNYIMHQVGGKGRKVRDVGGG